MATPGNLLAENYLPYVSENDGFKSANPIETSSDLTVGGNLNVTGDIVVDDITIDALTVTGNTILGDATSDTTTVNGVLTVTPTATAIGVTTAGGVAVKSGTAVPATAGAVAAGPAATLFSSGPSIYVTSDAPTHTAVKGSLCINTGGSSTSTRLYVNTDGGTTWTNFTSAA